MGAGLSTHHDVPQLLIRTKNTTVSLKDVPNEILFHILGYLDESPEELEAETLPQTQRNDCYRTHPLGALSMTNKYLRDACLPFLYQEIFLQGEVYHIWSRLGDIGRLPITKHQMIKSVHIIFVPSPDRFEISSDRAFFLLPYVLGKLKNLQKLELCIETLPDELTLMRKVRILGRLGPHVYDPADYTRRMEIPSALKLVRVHTLKMIPYSSFGFDMCPNVTSLYTTDFSMDFIVVLSAMNTPFNNATDDIDQIYRESIRMYSLSHAKCNQGIRNDLTGDFTKVQNLSINALRDATLLNDLVATMPQLKSLDLKPRWNGRTPSGSFYLDITADFIPTLSKFRQLKHLRFPKHGVTSLDDKEVISIYSSCTSLEDITLRGGWKIRVLRDDDDNVMEEGWHEGIEGVEGLDMPLAQDTRDSDSLKQQVLSVIESTWTELCRLFGLARV